MLESTSMLVMWAPRRPTKPATYTRFVHLDRTGGSRSAEVVGEVSSATWDGPTPDIAVVIATYQRADYLRELLETLELQTLEPGRFEVVVCDDGSRDRTWSVLESCVRSTPLRMRAVRAAESERGPALARNAAI